MIPIVIPQEDANSETALIASWLADDGAPVRKHQPICEVETSKMVFQVLASIDGWLAHGVEEGREVGFNTAIGMIVASYEELAKAREQLRASARAVSSSAYDAFAGRLTEKARRLIAEHDIPLSRLPDKPILTERDILPLIDAAPDYFSPLDQRVAPLDHTQVRTQRTLILGAGLGAMQVIDILAHDPRIHVLGYLDDNCALHGRTIYGLPILGPASLAEEWFCDGRCDAAIISVSTSNALRRRWYEWLKRLGMPLVNAIDPSARLTRGAVIGEGNVICAFVHVGVESRIGNNNFLSAYTSIDHHNRWESHITTGPAVATSGCVRVEDDVKMGTGIFIQPHLTIGRGALIASGAVLTRSVPALHAAKTRINTELIPL